MFLINRIVCSFQKEYFIAYFHDNSQIIHQPFNITRNMFLSEINWNHYLALINRCNRYKDKSTQSVLKYVKQIRHCHKACTTP